MTAAIDLDTAAADRLVDACRVPTTLEPRRAGLWEIDRVSFDDVTHELARKLDTTIVERLGPYRSLTMLFRDTAATLHRGRGECVMEDSATELRRHLPLLLAARSRVLVSGLGLGCVVRGLLSKPDVEHIDVVEIDPSIINLVGAEFASDPRVTIHLGDAESIDWPDGTRWDYAWHDVWSEQEPLDLVHARILLRYRDLAQHQGVWQLDRSIKRAWAFPLLGQAARRIRQLERAP